ncbi:MAG TPA: TadE/TadG family type IV pilus assembly protein [Oscillospiraceae bacterium]|nr:TadE/TadG family type IV pilus assembly protein [Oscillospiraceae bacterium]
MGKFLKKLFQKQQGQAITEMALTLPILLLILLGIIQFGFIFNGQIAVASAAREGARLAAVGAQDAEITATVQSTLAGIALLDNQSTNVTPSGTRIFGQQVTVEVAASTNIVVPFFNLVLGENFNHTSSATMRVEFVQGGS